jgi:hypothetical protein
MKAAIASLDLDKDLDCIIVDTCSLTSYCDQFLVNERGSLRAASASLGTAMDMHGNGM